MPVSRRYVLGNSVRIPKVNPGEAILVGRYNKDTPKAAIIAPEDLDALEESQMLLTRIEQALEIHADSLTLKAHALEETPNESSITDPEAIVAALGL
jgi:hypothetical protein